MSYSTHPTKEEAGYAVTSGIYVRGESTAVFGRTAPLFGDVVSRDQAVLNTVHGHYAATIAQDNIRSDAFSFRLSERELEQKFNELIKKWQEETGGQSSLSRITGNRHYLRIIGEFGKKAIPLILKRLQTTPEPWFVALRAITEEYQVGSQCSGNFRKIADAWIEWGKQRGYI